MYYDKNLTNNEKLTNKEFTNNFAMEMKVILISNYNQLLVVIFKLFYIVKL
jgi:hypothetical protein